MLCPRDLVSHPFLSLSGFHRGVLREENPPPRWLWLVLWLLCGADLGPQPPGVWLGGSVGLSWDLLGNKFLVFFWTGFCTLGGGAVQKISVLVDLPKVNPTRATVLLGWIPLPAHRVHTFASICWKQRSYMDHVLSG